MKRYFLGLAANYKAEKGTAKHVFTRGREGDCLELEQFLGEKYQGKAILCKNGRSGLALVLKSYFDRGDKVLVNGFTCFAVYEAVKAAGLVPVFIDVSLEDLNFDLEKLEKAARDREVKGVIVQNTLGNPVRMERIEELARRYNLAVIEDLAHSAGRFYPDGREVGTVGTGVALSFGKEKAIDTISGGAAILRAPVKREVKAPFRRARTSDTLRARFYPMFGAMARGLTGVHLGGVFIRGLTGMHWIEKSADNRLDLERKISRFEAKLALEQLKSFKGGLRTPIREFYFVKDRDAVLEKLKRAGYYFSGFWYEKPVSPARYYKKVRFPEEECPNSVFAAEHIVNFPSYYKKSELKRAREIIEPYLIKEVK